MWRQGDILIERVAVIPNVALRRKNLILAEGEATGHMHQILDPRTAVLFETRTDLFILVAAASATIVHDEHRPIVLKRGAYRVWRQREYVPRRPPQMVRD